MDEILTLESQYHAATSPEERKKKGQFFTPPEISRFMAGMLADPFPRELRLLDPGAGVGSLSAAVCERVSRLASPRKLEIHLIENDASVLPYLRKTMKWCQDLLESNGHSLTAQIHGERDFILDVAASFFGEPSLFKPLHGFGQFDAVIMNPPYFKINKASDYGLAMDEVVHGQPNIYALFLAAAAKMVRPGGNVVAITPRSFCNGLYFREFRRWFFSEMSLERIHLFESRSDTFREVLQESLITVSRRSPQASCVSVSSSYGHDLSHARSRNLPSGEILDKSDGKLFLKIPVSLEDTKVVETVESWPKRFEELGLRVSTGPVVSFRARDYLVYETDNKNAAPLLSVHNVKPFLTIWPGPARKHPVALRVCPESRRILLPARNYVLLRRFSAKEERRRLTASWMLGAIDGHSNVAIENHLNYIYHAERDLTPEETIGLTALLNSTLIDRYFRTISGNTQVNATEIRSMHFPELDSIRRIGRRVAKISAIIDSQIDSTVCEELGVDNSLRVQIKKTTSFKESVS
jgi:adenine-specific DNA-methyltransferase